NYRATREEEKAARERHVGEVAAQRQHDEQARNDRQLRASENHGKPPIAATARPANFQGGVAAQQGGHYSPPNRGNGNGNVGAPTNNNAEHNNVRPNAENNAPRNA